MSLAPPRRSLGPLLRHVTARGTTLGLGAAVLPFLPLLTRSRRFRQLPHRLLRAAPPVAADLIHVLGGSHASPTVRIDHAMTLFRAGLAPRLLLTGTGFGVNWAQCNRNRALELGAAEEDLELDPAPRSTRGEARALRELVIRQGYRSVIVVTEAFHAGRAFRLFEHALEGTGARVTSCPAALAGFPPEAWWQDPSLRSLLLGEALRILVARAAGDLRF